MVRRTAQFYTYGSDAQCLELMKYLEESGVRLDIRDIEKEPLTGYELRKLIGFCNVYHFLNPISPSYDKHDLGTKDKNREEVLELILKDYTLIRQPLIRTSRLTTIGCDKKILDRVLMIGIEPPPIDVGNRGGLQNQSRTGGGSNQSRSKGGSRPSRGSQSRGGSRGHKSSRTGRVSTR